MSYLLGIDVGSTTVKTVVLDEKTGAILYSSYERHFSRVKECVLNALEKVGKRFGSETFRAAITGYALPRLRPHAGRQVPSWQT